MKRNKQQKLVAGMALFMVVLMILPMIANIFAIF